MASLYEIESTYRDLLFAIENGEIPEEAIADTLNAVEGEIDVKIDNTACYIKNLLGEIEAIKTEVSNLTDRRKAKEKTIERLKTNILNSMQFRNLKKIETSRNLISIRATKGSVKIEDEDKFIKWAKDHVDEFPNILVEQQPKISKTELGELLDNGFVLQGVSKEKGQTLNIK